MSILEKKKVEAVVASTFAKCPNLTFTHNHVHVLFVAHTKSVRRDNVSCFDSGLSSSFHKFTSIKIKVEYSFCSLSSHKGDCFSREIKREEPLSRLYSLSKYYFTRLDHECDYGRDAHGCDNSTEHNLISFL